MSYTYKYPRPAVTADIILFTNETIPRILLIKRKHDPYKDKWAFPGGFMDENETLENAAQRELKEETNLNNANLKQFKTYSDPKRDPRGRTITTVFWSIINKEQLQKTRAGDDAVEAKWFAIDNLPPLAFDHNIIISEFKSFLNYS
ncbi:MAG: NUDIX hydrolase [Salinivirgaceae bacterium]|nr:MAG: NUDIX hydrolase [Salinivirgaceae bacterium]